MMDTNQSLIAKIATALSGTIGGRFFDSLAQHLAGALAADFVLIGERLPHNPGRVRSLSVFDGGRPAPPVQYDLDGTPCETLLQGELRIYPSGISALFPADRMLAEAGAQAYAGIPLIASGGATMGLIAVLWRAPLEDARLARAVLDIFAGRAAAEMERQQVHQALIDSRQRYRDFIERSAESLFRVEFEPPVPLGLPAEEVFDRVLVDGRIAELNDRAAQMAGVRSARELLGLRLADLPILAGEYDRFRQQIRDGLRARSYHVRARDADGKMRCYERVVIPIQEDGRLLRAWGMARDLTAQEHARQALEESCERYRTLFECAGDAVLVLREGVEDCNSRALEMFRATSEQLYGRPVWRLSPEFQPDGRPSAEKAPEYLARVAQGETLTFEWRHRRLDGEEFDAEVTVSPVSIGGERYRVALIDDITGRKQAEQRLRDLHTGLERLVAERTAQLQSANQEMEAFSGSVSQHLRAAIRGISLSSQALLDGYGEGLDQEGRQWLEHIHSDTQQLDKLTQALLDLSQVSRAALHRGAVDLGELARAAAQRLSQADRSRRVEFRIAPDLRATGDAVLLRVVMDNLLANAWKFSRRRECAMIEVGAEGPVFFVRDNGVGFDMQQAGKLFGAFQRLHRSEEFEGTGIGLATVRRVIHRHGGRVWAVGAPDAGATIRFTVGE